MLMFTMINQKASDKLFIPTLKMNVIEAQTLYELVLEKMPKRVYEHIEDPEKDSDKSM